MPRIFVSYRRADSSAYAGRIYDHLEQAFGKPNIFKDVDNIPPGMDFRSYINDAVNHSDVMLVIIGPHWLDIQDQQGGRRLDNPKDYVRIELETGLEQKKIAVIPVLVGDASMPDPDNLTPSIQELAFRNAVRIRDDPDFRRDVEYLVKWLASDFKRLPFEPDEKPLGPPQVLVGKRTSRLSLGMLLGGFAVVLLLVILVAQLSQHGDGAPDRLTQTALLVQREATPPTDITHPSPTLNEVPTPTEPQYGDYVQVIGVNPPIREGLNFGVDKVVVQVRYRTQFPIFITAYLEMFADSQCTERLPDSQGNTTILGTEGERVSRVGTGLESGETVLTISAGKIPSPYVGVGQIFSAKRPTSLSWGMQITRSGVTQSDEC
jgi:hypothetical protein